MAGKFFDEWQVGDTIVHDISLSFETALQPAASALPQDERVMKPRHCEERSDEGVGPPGVALFQTPLTPHPRSG